MSYFGIILTGMGYQIISIDEYDKYYFNNHVFCSESLLLLPEGKGIDRRFRHEHDNCSCKGKDTKEYINSKLKYYDQEYITDKENIKQNRTQALLIIFSVSTVLLLHTLYTFKLFNFNT